MTETSSSSTPPSSSEPASGAGSSGAPGTPGKDPATAPDLEAGQALAGATSSEETMEPSTTDTSIDGGGDTQRDKSTIGNIR